jgi:hypothetical protein
LHAGAFNALRQKYRNIWGSVGLLFAACAIAFGRLARRHP